VALDGTLTLPENAAGIVLFAHGSGSSRFSSRNRRVARRLQAAGFATLLFDLLTSTEEREDDITGALRFDIGFLATRLGHATRWVREHFNTRGLRIGYFGASTGAAAALVAAAVEPADVSAIVSRGGRPDLAGEHLARVSAPTLLIVGGADQPVIPLNEEALRRLRGVKRMEIVPGATHLFEQPGALEAVAELAAHWFSGYVRRSPQEGDAVP
jgi:dienelactone hydrolase